MQVDFGLPGAGAPRRPAVLTIGNFDGIHLGHQAIVERLVGAAREQGCEPVLVTFDPHPRCILDPDNCPPRLTTLDEKASLLEGLGVGRVVVLEFTRALSRWSAERFVGTLAGAFALRRLVVGYDFALGQGRRGDVPFLRRWGAAHGVEVEAVGPVAIGDSPASSSRIRSALVTGDVAQAAHLLGHPYFLDSWVEHGEKVGTRIGFPTANLAVTPSKCLPARGVYAMWLRLDGAWQPAATNVGYRPTFGGDHLTVEAHLLDYRGDIYHRKLRAVFVARLRDEHRYESVEALVEQIGRDVERTRRVLRRHPPPGELE